MTTPENGAILDPLEDLLDALDLQSAGSAPSTAGGAADDNHSDFGVSDADVFIGRSQPMPHGRVFGGQVLAQSVIAAGRTVNDLDDATLKKWQALAQPVWKDYSDKNETCAKLLAAAQKLL